jgi:hypothetical protein
MRALEKLTGSARESVQKSMTDWAVEQSKQKPIKMGPQVRNFLGAKNVSKILASSGIVAGTTAGNALRSLQGKPPGVQKRELQEMRSSNPNMPTGEER